MITRAPDHAVLRTQLQEARWLLRSLEITQRHDASRRRTIVERQQAFLDRGEESMQPMILRDVAEAVADARVDDLARDDRQVPAHAARRVRVPLLLLEPRARRGRRGRFLDRDPCEDPQADRAGSAGPPALRPAARGDARGRRRSRSRAARSPSTAKRSASRPRARGASPRRAERAQVYEDDRSIRPCN